MMLLLNQMTKVKTIALNTVREAIHNKVFYNSLIFALLVIAASVLVGDLSLGLSKKVIKDVGLAAILIFGLLSAVLIGTSLVSKEDERRTLYTILAKPLHRYEFLLGKYIGLCLTLLINVVVMAMFLQVVLFWRTGAVTLSLTKAVLLIYCELTLVAAIALFFSTLTSQTLSTAFTLALYAVGHLTADLKTVGMTVKGAFSQWLIGICYYVLPNFNNFNIRADVVYGVHISNSHLLSVVLYGGLYIMVFLCISVLSFQRKEFH